MTNEEFQILVLEELKGIKSDISDLKSGQGTLESGMRALEEGQKRLEGRQGALEEGQKRLEERQGALEEGQKRLEERQGVLDEGQNRIENKLAAVYDQTAILTEFRTEANMKLDSLIEDNKSIHEMLGEHEISIRTLRRKPV
ncbi:chromosome partition protein Smc [Ruminiclostridium hungatei]|uniref:Chromosome partition protein Smc n=1 Tax=Ruminiclostridium hungatei TaxID=48256 RepID=A0A1V4SNU2_RUMHU|nr:hydrolase [Ruminiclostridium hungatei]OPX44907.1 chromosome partition protein Smc [Ruminiclostridium hungatei]